MVGGYELAPTKNISMNFHKLFLSSNDYKWLTDLDDES